MSIKDRQSMIIQTLIAIFAILVGYPTFGNMFIILMAPIVVFMVFQEKAIYLPALIIHCISETSIIFLIAFSILIVCVKNYRKISKDNNLLIFFWGLILTLPLYIMLTYQKMIYDGFMWQQALMYSAYYLSFWCFLYGYNIAKTYDWKILRHIIFIITLLLIISSIFSSVRMSRIYNMMTYVGVIYGLYLIFNTKLKLLGCFVSVISLSLTIFDKTSTFTELLSVIISIIIYFLWRLNYTKFARNIFGVFAYLIIFIIMIVSINNYNYTNVDYSEFSDIENSIYNRIMYKLYDDRAVFWLAGWEQIVEYRPILPMHNIPDIIAYRNNGNILDASTFGTHNTPLQLIRIFGIIMGSILIICYMYTTSLAANILLCKDIDKRIIPFIITITSYATILFLTGTAIMLLQFSLFFFGIMGIAYNISCGNKDKVKISNTTK